MSAYSDREIETFRDSCKATELYDALLEARAERDEARADHLRVRDECFAVMEAEREARKDAEDWKRIATDNGSIVDAARDELARWERMEALTAHDAILMRGAFHRALMG